MWEEITEEIRAATGSHFRILSRSPLAGGCINRAVKLQGERHCYFVKFNGPEYRDMFAAEAAGLAALADSGAIRVPEVISLGGNEKHSWLVLEYLELGAGDGHSQHLLGEQLATLHRQRADRFGWDRDNTIGLTPQRNGWHRDWPGFLAQCRLGPQLDMAAGNGVGAELVDSGQRLLLALPRFFGSYQPAPSLLHGDLWGGNWAADSEGAPVLFDPAVYFGDREADIAMTELFGGFEPAFYRAYGAGWALDEGYPVRKSLYNLYHILNHFNLFGGGYARQATALVQRLLAEL